jgi:anti-sigma B factor antagonist
VFDIKVDGSSIVLVGRFDASQTDRAKQVFGTLDGSAVVDFSQLDYISSAGLGVLLFTQKRLVAAGESLKLTHLNDHIREIFRIAGFDRIFEVE